MRFYTKLITIFLLASSVNAFGIVESKLIGQYGSGKAWMARIAENGDQKISLKCDPDKAIELRESYEDITAGWHMSKKHWNTVALNTESISDDFAIELINHSY